MKRLLVIGYVWPEPNSSAAGSRMLQLLSTFQDAGYQITYGSPAEDSSHSIDLTSLDIHKAHIQLNCSSFDRFICELDPQVVLFDRFMMEEQFGWRVEKHCPDAIRILDTEDLHFLRHARHQALKQNRLVTKEDLFSDTTIRELAAIYRCDLSLMISQFEISLLTETFKLDSSLIHYVPFMLDVASISSDVNPFHQRQHFVSIGSFRHEPNWDAVLHLKTNIWPSIRQQIPDAELHIYGSYPPKKATQLHNEKQGFLVKGWTPDALYVISQAKVLLAPLRFGAGLKGKLIDAAMMGTPAVTTPVGAEGMYDEKLISPAVVCEDDTAFISSAVSVYQNDSLWRSLSHAGPEMLKQRFDQHQHAPALLERVSEISEHLDEHRLNNFHGCILRHHTLKSTQYMAQWIEAKNKLKETESL